MFQSDDNLSVSSNLDPSVNTDDKESGPSGLASLPVVQRPDDATPEK